MAGIPLPVGTVIPIGGDAPPTTTAKASAGLLWGGLPALAGGILVALQQFGALFPDSPPVVLQIIALLLIVLSPVAAYYGVKREPNKLEQAVQIVDDPGKHAAPENPGI